MLAAQMDRDAICAPLEYAHVVVVLDWVLSGLCYFVCVPKPMIAYQARDRERERESSARNKGE